MRVRSLAVPLLSALAALALITLWGLALSSALFASGLDAILVGLVTLALLPDAIDLLVRIVGGPTHVRAGALDARPSTVLEVGEFSAYRKRLHLKPYALLVSVHNIEGEIDKFAETFGRFFDRLWVVDDASSDRTSTYLDQLGVNFVRSAENLRKPGALRLLMTQLPSDIETVVVVDPDTRLLCSREDFEELLFELQRSGMSAFTPRIDVAPGGVLASLQRLEYFMSLEIGRKSMGDFAVTSGVAIYSREAFAAALDEHSLSVYGEDLEASLILLGQDKRIYYDDRVTFETAAKTTWSGLYSQRVGWSYGLLRVYLSRFRDVRRVARRQLFSAYQYLVYLGFACLVLQPLRLLSVPVVILSLATGIAELAEVPWDGWFWIHPSIFAATYIEYIFIAGLGLVFGVPRGQRLQLAPIVPFYFFYALFMILPASQGYLNWLTLRLFGRRLYSDHYQDDASLAREVAPMKHKVRRT